MVELEIKPTAAAVTRVTVVILIAIAISLTLVYLLTGGGRIIFASHSTIYTYLPDSGGLVTDAEVRLSGIPIGSVKKIELSGLLDPQRAVRVEMLVDTNYLRSIPADSQTSITADNLVGDQFISIDEGKSPIPVHADGTLASEPLKQAADRADLILSLRDKLHQVDDMLTQMSSPSTTIGRFVNGTQEYDEFLARVRSFNNQLHSLEGPDSQVGQALFSDALYNQVRKYVSQVDDTMSAIQRGEGASGQLFASDKQYIDFVRNLHDLRNSLAEANAGRGQFGPLLHDDAAYRKIRQMLAQTDAMIASLNAGEGGVGRLLANPQLYESLVGSLKGIQDLLADLQQHPQKYLRYKVF
jgi:phospholipid/cholesterol/gamma-HCH transport system substrate-binding protein